MAKVLVTMDDALLKRIDGEARNQGLTRSAYLARLAAADVNARRGPGREARVRRAMGRLDRLFESAPGTTTADIRKQRDTR